MKTVLHRGPTEVVIVGLEPGDMLLESVREAVVKHDIASGAIVSGIGTLKNCRMHFVEAVDFPPVFRQYEVARPLELLSISGIVANGEPHLHVVISRGDNEIYAGHLEEGSEVAHEGELAILKFDGLRLLRRLDPVRGVRVLGPNGP